MADLAGVQPGPRSGVVLVSGDAGIGKTRLLHALASTAHDRGWLVGVGQCLDLGGSPLPYLPIVEAFGRLEAQSSAVQDALATGYVALRRLLPRHRQSATEPSAANTTDRTELFEAVHRALSDLAAATPLLLIIEDLHWADQSTRDLLNYLFYRGFPAPVSIVGSYRSEDLHRRHPLRAAAAQWGRLPGVERLVLDPLPDSDVRDLVRAIHPEPLAAGEVQAVIERAEGNAFFTEELVAASAMSDGIVPADLSGLLLVRLDQLDESARQVARAASVAGRHVSHQMLARVVDVDTGHLEDALRAAVDLNVLVAENDRYAFRHALLGEAVYDDLLPGERIRLHSAYVHALQSAEVPGSAADLARHARAAHDHHTALTASIQAGDESAQMGGPDEALRHYEWALELAEDSADRSVDVNGLVIRASAAATTAGLISKAIDLVQDRLEQLPDGTPPQSRAALLTALATAIMFSESTMDPLKLTMEALQLVPATPDSELRCQVLHAHAQALSDRQRDEEAVRWGDEAREMARRLGLDDVVTQVTAMLAKLQERTGDAESSKLALKKIIEETHARRDPGEIRAHYHLGGLHFERGRLDEALESYRVGGDRARELGRPYAPYGIDSRGMAGLTSYLLGDWDGALRLVDTAGETPPPVSEAALSAVAMLVAVGRGEDTAGALLARTLPWWEHDGSIATTAGGAGIDYYGQRGDLTGAERIHDEVVVRLSAIWQLPAFQARIRLSAQMIGQFAAQARGLDEADRATYVARADELTAAALAAAEAGAKRRPRGPESTAWLARLEAERLRLRAATGIGPPAPDDHITAWRRAVEGFDAFPHVFERARSQARLAAALRTAGDEPGAAAIAEEARATAVRLQAAPLLAEVDAITPGRHADRPTGNGPLTPRELEVLALVAEGRSNRDIGTALFISTKTASVHVSNILAKLDAATRTEAATLARRRGLLDADAPEAD